MSLIDGKGRLNQRFKKFKIIYMETSWEIDIFPFPIRRPPNIKNKGMTSCGKETESVFTPSPRKSARNQHLLCIFDNSRVRSACNSDVLKSFMDKIPFRVSVIKFLSLTLAAAA